MKETDKPLEDETLMTEITIQPDGRVFVFGASQPVLEVLRSLQPRCPKLQHRLELVQSMRTAGAPCGDVEAAPARAVSTK
jgi:hypothetical protein